MTVLRNRNIRLAVFVAVIALFMALNIREDLLILKSYSFYTSLRASKGQAIRNYVDRVRDVKQRDRNWYAYELVERHFRGWTLVTHEVMAGMFSAMYRFSFGGIKETRVARYDPELTAEEADRLLRMGIWRGEFERLGTFVIVPPDPQSGPDRAVILRRGSTVFLAPAAHAPKRMVIPE